MENHTNHKRYALSTLVACTAFSFTATGALISDPSLASGPGDIIDPTGGQDVDQSFGTAQATLEARSDLRVVQDFSGYSSAGTNGGTATNTISFTDSTHPDIQIQITNSASFAGDADTDPLYTTSTGSAILTRNADPGSNSSVMTITFGTWDGTSFTGDRTVDAAAFALTHLYDSKTGTVLFRDSSGATLTDASFGFVGDTGLDVSSPGDHKDIYFGWDADAQATAAIGSIEITFVDSGNEFNSGFDDLAFTVVPEPSSLALLGLGGLLIARRRRG